MSDFLFQHHGSIGVLVPLSPAGRDWVEANLPADAMQWGKGVVIENRYIGPVLDGLASDGLEVV